MSGIPGMTSSEVRDEKGRLVRPATSYAIPVCSDCGSQMQKNDAGEWFCLSCADRWLRSFVDAKTGEKSLGGVVLPRAVRDARKKTPTFRDVFLNRRHRRRLKTK